MATVRIENCEISDCVIELPIGHTMEIVGCKITGPIHVVAAYGLAMTDCVVELQRIENDLERRLSE